MKFYKRFVGDFQAKTGHLSLAEVGAYDRLLDHCYSTEQPLPGDLDACCRIARAMSKEERKAVESVLCEFFTVTDAGYTQGRVLEMLAEAQPKIEANKANGKLGGRPKKKPIETQEKPSGFLNQTQVESESEPNENLSQSQITTPSLRSGVGRASRLPSPFVLPEPWAEWARQERPDLDPVRVAEKFADYWHSKPGKAGTKLDWQATWRNWVRDEKQQRQPAAQQSFAAQDQRRVEERASELAPGVARRSTPVHVEETRNVVALGSR